MLYPRNDYKLYMYNNLKRQEFHLHRVFILVFGRMQRFEVKVAQLCLTLCDPLVYSPWNSPGQNTGVGSHSLLQGIFPTQGSNPGLPHFRKILYQLSPRTLYQGSLRILQWVAYPFSRSSQSRNQTRVSCIASRFFTS